MKLPAFQRQSEDLWSSVHEPFPLLSHTATRRAAGLSGVQPVVRYRRKRREHPAGPQALQRNHARAAK